MLQLQVSLVVITESISIHIFPSFPYISTEFNDFISSIFYSLHQCREVWLLESLADLSAFRVTNTKKMKRCSYLRSVTLHYTVYANISGSHPWCICLLIFLSHLWHIYLYPTHQSWKARLLESLADLSAFRVTSTKQNKNISYYITTHSIIHEHLHLAYSNRILKVLIQQCYRYSRFSISHFSHSKQQQFDHRGVCQPVIPQPLSRLVVPSSIFSPVSPYIF